MTLRGRKRGCWDDRFSTLSLKAKWLTIIVSGVTLAVACFVLLYLFAIEKAILTIGEDKGGERTAPLTSGQGNDPNAWSPRCQHWKPLDERFDCYPENPNVDIDRCEARGCCWSGLIKTRPFCYYPENYGYGRVSAVRHYFDGLEVSLQRLDMPTRYGDDIQNIQIRVEFQTPYRLRVKLYDPEETRYEVPEPQIKAVIPGPEDPVRDNVPLYSVAYNTTSWPFHIKLRRTKTDTVIFDTSVGGLTFAHQFLQLSAKVASHNLYGLGDNKFSRFKLDLNRTRWTLFSRNDFSQSTSFGVHPFYMCMENDGKAHGVLLLNSSPLEIELQEMPAVTFRALGGLMDFYFLLGPTPEDVVRQYLEAVGYPFMPPYWALGLHTAITEYGSIDDIRQLVEEMNARDIPRDAIHLGTEFLINHTMIPSKNSLDIENIRQLQNDINARGLKLTVSFGPGIPSDQPRGKYPMYDYAMHTGLCINTSMGEMLEGQMWSSNFAYLDYGNPSTVHWLTELTKQNHIPFHYDGVWLEMEAPVNFVNGSINGCMQDNLNNPPYIPNSLSSRKLYKNTLCMDAKQWWGGVRYSHYNLHNLYGLAMAKAYHSAQKTLYKHKRPITISSSAFVGSGQYSGHMITTGQGTWDNLSRTIARALQYSLYGIPLTGVDACPSDVNDEELCLRWLQLGAFMPLFYSSSLYTINSMPDASEEFLQAVHHLVNRRYELLPYLYTLFHMAHTKGETVLRPLMHEFPHDNTTYDIDTQFLWGSALLISPVLEKEVEYFSMYLPRDIWYDYDTGNSWKSDGSWQITHTSLFGNGTDSLSLFVRGGHVIPTQEPSNSTVTSRKNPMKLIVALNDKKEAHGELMWDDGETPDIHLSGEFVHVKFVAKNGKLTILSHPGKSAFSTNFDYVHITHVKLLGLMESPAYVTINKDFYLNEKQKRWDQDNKVLHLENILIPLTMKTVICWFQ